MVSYQRIPETNEQRLARWKKKAAAINRANRGAGTAGGSGQTRAGTENTNRVKVTIK